MRRVIPSKGGFVDEAADDSYREGCRTLLRSRDSWQPEARAHGSIRIGGIDLPRRQRVGDRELSAPSHNRAARSSTCARPACRFYLRFQSCDFHRQPHRDGLASASKRTQGAYLPPPGSS